MSKQHHVQSSSVWLVLAALAFVVGGGIVHGTMTHRWQSVARTNGPETRLASIPMQLGEWDGEDGELSETERSAAGVTHYLLRSYSNKATGDVVTVTLMCGPSGPIAVHPPTACYHGAGYQQSGVTRSVLLQAAADQPNHAFAVADFYKPARADQPQPRIYWAWSNNGEWKTPESPRLEFAGSPVLFKLYVTCERPIGSTKSKASPIDDFLRLLLVEIQQNVFSVPRPSGSGPPSSMPATP